MNYILPNKRSYPFSDIYATLFAKSVYFFYASMCFLLFEVTFFFKIPSLPSKYVFFTKGAISILLAEFACANFVANLCDFNLLNSRAVTYLLP